MSMDCEKCVYFDGFDYSDGTPLCGKSDDCPFNDYSSIKQNGIKIEINSDFMSGYIRHTLSNTIENKSIEIAQKEIEKIIDKDLKSNILLEMDEQIKVIVNKSILEFMGNDITIGGGWSEPERTLTREQYLSELIQDELDKKIKSNVIKDEIIKIVKKEIDSYNNKLREEINKKINQYFDAATRETLTNNVVSMLMSNDTYKTLSDNMKALLPGRENK